MELGRTLRRLRTVNGYTQQDVADRLEVTRNAVCYWEQGKAMPRARALEQLADLFGVKVSELLGEEAVQVQAVFGGEKNLGGGSPCKTPWRCRLGLLTLGRAASSRSLPKPCRAATLSARCS